MNKMSKTKEFNLKKLFEFIPFYASKILQLNYIIVHNQLVSRIKNESCARLFHLTGHL